MVELAEFGFARFVEARRIMRLDPVPQEPGRHRNGEPAVRPFLRLHAGKPARVEIFTQFHPEPLGNPLPGLVSSPEPACIRHVVGRLVCFSFLAKPILRPPEGRRVRSCDIAARTRAPPLSHFVDFPSCRPSSRARARTSHSQSMDRAHSPHLYIEPATALLVTSPLRAYTNCRCLTHRIFWASLH